MRGLWIVGCLVIVAGAIAWGWRTGTLFGWLPAWWDPQAALRLDDPPTVVTRWKLSRALAEPAACRALLPQTGFRYEPVPDRDTGPGCGFRNAVRIDGLATVSSAPAFTLSCPAAIALALWERRELAPTAERLLGRQVARLEHFGSYACRNVYGREFGRRSAHATADALDVAGFVLEDGTRLRVLADYASPAPGGQFLRTVRDGACRHFGLVLGPDYNAAHRDHFHFEARGRFRLCR